MTNPNSLNGQNSLSVTNVFCLFLGFRALLTSLNSLYVKDLYLPFDTRLHRAVITARINIFGGYDWKDGTIITVLFFRSSFYFTYLRTRKLPLGNISQVSVTRIRCNELCVDATDASMRASTSRVLFTESVLRAVTSSYNLLLLVDDPITARQPKEATEICIIFF